MLALLEFHPADRAHVCGPVSTAPACASASLAGTGSVATIAISGLTTAVIFAVALPNVPIVPAAGATVSAADALSVLNPGAYGALALVAVALVLVGVAVSVCGAVAVEFRAGFPCVFIFLSHLYRVPFLAA